MDYSNRTYAFANTSTINNVDFALVMETSINTVRKSLDSSQFILKWYTSSIPRFITDGSGLTNLQRPITTVGTNPFTASSANSGEYFRMGGNVTCSIFVTASVSCTVGSEFEIFQTSSAGYVLFETGSGVTLNSKGSNLNLAGQFSAATLKYVGNNEWDLIGDLG